jgi:hypothetical protein
MEPVASAIENTIAGSGCLLPVNARAAMSKPRTRMVRRLAKARASRARVSCRAGSSGQVVFQA